MPIDPQAAALLERIRAAGRPAINELPVPESRRQYESFCRAVADRPLPVQRAQTLAIPGPASELNIRVYAPHTGTLPVLVYYHGGGFVIGSLDTHDVLCRILALRTPCAVVSVDYRLAPEFKFPAAVDDAVAAMRWVAAHASDIGGDPQRIAVAGDSAGGNLAAVVCHLLTRKTDPRLRKQVLFYPQTDFSFLFPSHDNMASEYRLTRELIHWFKNHYLRSDRDIMDPRASPLRFPCFAGLPPAHIVTARFDPLCDEGEAYARKLAGAGVPVEYRCHEGMIHGFCSMTGVIDAASEALAHAAQSLNAAFADDGPLVSNGAAM